MDKVICQQNPRSDLNPSSPISPVRTIIVPSFTYQMHPYGPTYGEVFQLIQLYSIINILFSISCLNFEFNLIKVIARVMALNETIIYSIDSIIF